MFRCTVPAIIFGELVARYIFSGAICQKTLEKKANGTVYVIRHNLHTYCDGAEHPRSPQSPVADVEYAWNRIMVRRSWVEAIGNCKNAAPKRSRSDARGTRRHMRQWHEEIMHARLTDWVFASSRIKGAKPRCGSIASQSYLYPAALKAGVLHSVGVQNWDGKLVPRYFDLAGNRVIRWVA